nr:MAG TPA: hypothetical protein [Caudoviricetes sp.]
MGKQGLCSQRIAPKKRREGNLPSLEEKLLF